MRFIRDHRFKVLLLLALAPSAALPPAGAGDEEKAPVAGDGTAALRRIAEGYLKNRGSLAAFRCEFRFATGRAPSIEAGLKDGPTLGRLTARCSWTVDGKNVRYLRAIDRKARAALEESLKNPETERIRGEEFIIAAIPLDELGFLTDGTRLLRYDPKFVANLSGPERIEELIEGLSPEITPWALGGLGMTMGSNPGRWILDGKYGAWSFRGEESVEGRKCLVAECRREAVRTRYFFDPGRGFLPIRREWEFTSGDRAVLRIPEIRECPGGRWFPVRVVKAEAHADGSAWRVQEIAVTALETDLKPAPEDFVIEMASGTQVLHVEDLRSAFRLLEAEKFGLKDLERLHERCRNVLERRRDER